MFFHKLRCSKPVDELGLVLASTDAKNPYALLTL